MKNSGNKPQNFTFAKLKGLAFDYFVITAGSVIYALSVVIFTSPNNIAPGGLTGVATMLNFLFALPIGTIIFLLNIPLFVWGAFENGTSFLAKTLTGTALVSISIDVLTPLLPTYTGDEILASIFGGILNGLGLGLIFSRGGSTGGVDIIALNVHKKLPHISTGNVILLSDTAVLVMVYFVYNSFESVMYALVAIFVSIKVIDTVSLGTSRDHGKLMFVVTNNYQAVRYEILNNIERGATLINAVGAYSGEKKRVVMCAVRPQQVFKLTNAIKQIDPRSFIIVTTASAIQGEGFLNINKN